MRRFCLTLNLKPEAGLIKEYEAHHQAVWPEVIKSIKDAGIQSMEIYRYATTLLMIIEVADYFSFEEKQQADLNNEKVQAWEASMLKYQQPFAEATKDAKWMLMNKIFDLKEF